MPNQSSYTNSISATWAAASILLSSWFAAPAFSDDCFNATLDHIQVQLDREAPIKEQTFKQLEAVLTADAHNFKARMLLGACYDRVGLPDLATEQYELSAKYWPDSPQAALALIKSQLERGLVDQAMHLLEASRKRFPSDPELIFWSGNYMLSKDRTSEAKALYELAMQRNRNVLGLPSALGEVLLQEGRSGDAVRLADRDLAQNKKFWLAYKVKGNALLARGRYAQAYAPLKVAYQHMTYKANVARNFAFVCLWMGHYTEAVEPALINLALTSSLDDDSDKSKKLLFSILSKARRNEASFVIEKTDTRVRRLFGNAAYHFALGDVLDHAGWYDLAINEYKLGLSLKPDYARGIFRLGKDLEIQKAAYEDALACYLRASALSPEDREIAAYRERLEMRLPSRKQDLAWHLRDWLRGNGR